MNQTKFLAIRDTREKDGWDWGEDNFCRGTKLEKVEYGDYSIDGLQHLIFIERKATSSEVANNICEERFKKLIDRARNFRYKYIICEFPYSDILSFPVNSGIPHSKFKYLKVNSKFLNLFLTNLTMDGFNVIFADTPENAEHFCYNLLKYIFKTEESKNAKQ